jgi:penicillin-binding protein 1A
VLEEAKLVQNSVLRPEIAYIMTDLMKRVFQVGGTGTPGNIGRPAAGKTGTTDNYETAWFIGYTPELLAGIFVGNDDRSTVEISGTQVAGMWGKMMTKACAKLPPSDFTVPADVITGVPICTDSGKLATPGCPEIEYDAFVRGTEPTAIDSRVRAGQPGSPPGEGEPPAAPPATPPPPRWRMPWM